LNATHILAVVLSSGLEANSDAILLIPARAGRFPVSLMLNDEHIMWLCSDQVVEIADLPSPYKEAMMNRIRAHGVLLYEIEQLLELGAQAEPEARLQAA